MKVYLVWYINPELGEEAALYGIYRTMEQAQEALTASGFTGWVNEEPVL